MSRENAMKRMAPLVILVCALALSGYFESDEQEMQDSSCKSFYKKLVSFNERYKKVASESTT